jgi:hypothetical protein
MSRTTTRTPEETLTAKKEYGRAYYASHREKSRKTSLDYYHAHRQEAKDAMKA